MTILKKAFVMITFGLLVLTPFTAVAIQMQTVAAPHPSTWPTVVFEFDYGEYDGIYEFNAGEFQLIVGLGDDAFDTVGYCVELDEGIFTPWSYDVDLQPVTFIDNGLDAAWLMNEYAYGLGNSPDDATIDEMLEAQAALQLAIWDTVYGDYLTISILTDDSIESLYTEYINGLAQAKSNGPYDTTFAANFSIAHQEDVQDLLIHLSKDSGAVPEPGTVMLMGCGLIFLGLIRRKSKKNKRAPM